MSLHFYKSYDNAVNVLRDLTDKVIITNGSIYAIVSKEILDEFENWILV
jgi:hypothetical protein